MSRVRIGVPSNLRRLRCNRPLPLQPRFAAREGTLRYVTLETAADRAHPSPGPPVELSAECTPNAATKRIWPSMSAGFWTALIEAQPSRAAS
jgi:hypothetical protein